MADWTQGFDAFFGKTAPRIQLTFAEFSEVLGSEVNWGGSLEKRQISAPGFGSDGPKKYLHFFP